MQKISDSTNTADSAGEFTEGNPVGGVPATQIKANWLNSIQRELVNLLKRAGLSPDVKKDDQMAEAVSRMVSAAAEFENIRGKPATLAGYGITDAYTQSQVNDLLENKASQAATLSGYGITDAYTQVQVNGLIADKATKATTLGGYGITDAYTQTQINTLLSDKAPKANTLGGYGIIDAYTKSAVDAAIGGKANTQDVYSKSHIDSSLLGKADKATTLGGYGITDALPNRNPLLDGSYDLHASTHAFVTAPLEASLCSNAYWDGAWKKHNSTQPAVAISASNGRAFLRIWKFGTGTASAPDESGEILHSGQQASGLDLDAGTSSSKWVSVSGLAYYFSKKLLAATESVFGITRYASNAEVIAGASGHIAVCPTYMGYGYGANFSPNTGYIKLPAWLGGFMLQWAYSDESNSGTDYRYFPLPFSAVFGGWLQLSSETYNGFAGSYGTILQIIDGSRYLWSAGGTFGGGGKGWILALGR